MSDTTRTAPAPSGAAPLTEDAFLADRQRFWGSFTGLILSAVIGLVVLLIVMAIFLL